MTARTHIRKEIIQRIDNVSDDMLLELLNFIKELEGKSKKERILSFSGIWKDLDDEFFDDLTKDLSTRRNNRGKPLTYSNTATALTGDPVPPLIFKGRPINRNRP